MGTVLTASRTIATLVYALIVLLLLGSMAAAEARGRHGGHGHGYRGHTGHWSHGHHHRHHDHRGHWRGGVSIGIGIGAAGYHYGAPWWYPGYGLVLPPSVVYLDRPRVEPPPEPIAKGPPDPIFYPRNGQSAAQTEADLHDCNRWALTQPKAAAQADVFHRATLACMEGRGYTVR